MPNQWWRQLNGKINQDLLTLPLVIVVIGIIGYLLFPNFFSDIYSYINPTVTTTSLNNVTLPSTSDPNNLNSFSYSSQTLPDTNNTLTSGNGNNDITTGYWILVVTNGAFQQLSVNAQDYAFVQRLINTDSKGTPANTVFLIDNGQIHKYVVSNELYSVISNMATIETRASSISPSTPSNISPNTSSNVSPNASSSVIP